MVHVAMLEGRIRCNEGKRQRYGTQFDWDKDGLLSPHPIDDETGKAVCCTWYCRAASPSIRITWTSWNCLGTSNINQ